MHLSAKQDSDRAAAANEVLRLVAQTAQPQQSFHRLVALLHEASGAAASVGVLFRSPLELASAGADVTPDPDALKAAAAGLAPGTVSAAALPLAHGFKSALLAPVYQVDALCGALYLLFNTTVASDEVVVHLLQAAADGAALIDRQMEQAVLTARAEQFAASLITAIHDPLITLDADRCVVTMNPAALRVFGPAHIDALGKPIEALIDSAELLRLIAGEAGGQGEWTAADGRAFVPHVEAVRSSDGTRAGWVIVLNDVTRFKRLIRNQSEFTRIVSHDLRTPMASMKGFADMLPMVGDLSDKQKYFVEKILSGITQMVALVDNIQDAGRYDPETGFYELSRTQCDICELVTRITNHHLIPAEKQDLTLTVETAADVPIINVDEHMLERAVTNLIDNAIKYTPNGKRIGISVRRADSHVIISVRDNGLGISPENQKLLFERHFRIARQEHRSIKGSGLGLFIVRSVAQRHGGQAWVESANGEGSTFFISIPLEGANLVGGQA